MVETSLPKRFHVLEEISRDEAEIVLRARDELLKREVMIHCPRPDPSGATDASDLDRSLRQARALARVQHPGVIRLLDVVETESGPALVVDPVAGESLRELLDREKRLTPERVRVLGLRLCEALEAVHAAGVVHRGISATNVVLRSDGTPCLTGFVFAKFGPGGTSVPATTFDYIARRKGASERPPELPAPPHPAPEQILGQPADARADVFGLGWVLYECLTGENPYPFDHDPERWPSPADPRKSVPGATKDLSDAVLRCLNPSPIKRFGSAREVHLALATPDLALAEPRPRKRIAIAAVVLGTIAVAGSALLLSKKLDREPRQVEAADELRGLLPKAERSPGEVLAPSPLSERYDHSRALLIGIGEIYAKNGFPVLPNAERDVAALAERLKAIANPNDPWSVEVLAGEAATHDGILARLSALASGAGENDKIFVYYAGHGAKHEVSEKSGWIIPADGVSQEKDASRKSWVRFDEFGHLFDESRSKHVLVAMDCCYGGRLVTSRSGASAAYSRRLVTEPAKIIISSGRPNEQVSDGVRGENSPFARAFLDALSRKDVDAVTTLDIFAGIRNKFLEEEVAHLPVRGNPPGAPQAGEVVFFLK